MINLSSQRKIFDSPISKTYNQQRFYIKIVFVITLLLIQLKFKGDRDYAIGRYKMAIIFYQ